MDDDDAKIIANILIAKIQGADSCTGFWLLRADHHAARIREERLIAGSMQHPPPGNQPVTPRPRICYATY